MGKPQTAAEDYADLAHAVAVINGSIMLPHYLFPGRELGYDRKYLFIGEAAEQQVFLKDRSIHIKILSENNNAIEKTKKKCRRKIAGNKNAAGRNIFLYLIIISLSAEINQGAWYNICTKCR